MNRPRVIVVGSGPCGAMAAHELVGRGLDVLMLDAGPGPARGVIVRAAGRTMFRWVDERYWHVDRQPIEGHPPLEWHFSHAAGGLSNYWTSAVPRFEPEDFSHAASLGAAYDWPVRYHELEPYYVRAEQMLVISANHPANARAAGTARYTVRMPADWARVASQTGEDVIEPMPLALGRPWMVARRGTGFNSYHCIVRELEDRPDFRLQRRARVVGVRWSSSDGRATGVEYIDGESKASVFAAGDAIVLAAGAVDTTRILLRSVSDDFPHGLGNTHDVLGRYLHDHPRQWWPVDLSTKLTAVTHPLYIARPPFQDGRPLEGYSMTVGLAGGRDRARALLGARVDEFGVQVFGSMVPDPEFTIALAPGADVDAPPVITLRYDDSAERQMERARERFTAMFAAAGITAVPRGPFHDLQPGSSIHLAGTVRMHDDPQFGMLDRWNALHSVPNVVVSDLSCFTTSPEKNPTLTGMALAARAASRLADRLLASDPPN